MAEQEQRERLSGAFARIRFRATACRVPSAVQAILLLAAR